MSAYIYIMTNKWNTTLYIGATRQLIHRVYAHKNKLIPGFTYRYNITKLIYFKEFDMYNDAFTIERRMKKWKRDWKVRVIEEMNPDWIDLYDCILGRRPLPTQGKSIVDYSASSSSINPT